MAAGEIIAEDQRAYRHVGFTLLGGLWASIAVMVIGLAMAALTGERESTRALDLDQEWSKLSSGNPAAVVDLGILLLFATPLLAVLAALVEFARQRDQTFVGITSGLIIILAAGFGVALH